MVLSLLYFVVQTKMPLSHGQDHLLLAIKQRMGIGWKRTDGPLSSNSPQRTVSCVHVLAVSAERAQTCHLPAQRGLVEISSAEQADPLADSASMKDLSGLIQQTAWWSLNSRKISVLVKKNCEQTRHTYRFIIKDLFLLSHFSHFNASLLNHVSCNTSFSTSLGVCIVGTVNTNQCWVSSGRGNLTNGGHRR